MEQDVSVTEVPFQYLKDLVGGLGRRARTEADRGLKYSKIALKEIDYDATKRSKKLTKEEEGFLITIQMGGGMGRQDLAALDADEANQIRNQKHLGLCRNHTVNIPAFRVCGPLPIDLIAGSGSNKVGRPFRTAHNADLSIELGAPAPQ